MPSDRLLFFAAALTLAAAPAPAQDLVVVGGQFRTNDAGTESFEDGFLGYDPGDATAGGFGVYRVRGAGASDFRGGLNVGREGGPFSGLEVVGAGSTVDAGSLTVRNGQAVADAGTVRAGAATIGSTNEALLLVLNGGRVELSSPGLSLNVGDRAGRFGTVDIAGPGSAVAAAGEAVIGGGGIADLFVRDGGAFSAGGTLTVGSGSARASGVGSRLDAAGTLLVGTANRFGEVRVEDGAALVTDDLILGRDGNSLGQLRVGSGGAAAVGDATVGGEGSGWIIVSDGGRFTGGALTVGAVPGGSGTLQVGTAGETARIDASSLSLGAGGELRVLENGVFSVAGDSVAAAGARVRVEGGTLVTDGTFTLDAGATLTLSGGTLAGDGAFGGTVVTNFLDTLAPGEGAASLGFGDLTLGRGAVYDWQVGALPGAGVAGEQWDLLEVAGTLTFAATAASPLVVAVSEVAGFAGFDPSRSARWAIARFGGTAGFDPAAITFDTSGFGSPLAGGAFAAELDGGALYASFSAAPVPEPGTPALVIVALGLGAAVRRRSR